MIESTITLIDSVGAWPEHSLEDINKARIKLMEMGHYGGTDTIPKLYAPLLIWHGLDCMFHKTAITYKQFFKNNNLANFVKDETLEEGLVLIQFENDTVQINDIQMDFDKTCSFCPNIFHIHHEAVKLRDGRLVCDECHTKVFDAVLRPLESTTKSDENGD